MTKFKQYLRAKGILLGCDFDVFPNMGICHVETHVLGNCIEVLTCYMDAPFTDQVVFDNNGRWSAPCERLYKHDTTTLNGFDDYVDWLRSKDYDKLYAGFGVMKELYLREKVRTAFLHVRAGIMDELAFHEWVDKLYRKTVSSLDYYE